MAMVRIWNITDGPNDHTAHNRMVLGKTLKPGQAVQVEEARLARAHKVNADRDAGLLAYGNRPPLDYQLHKNPVRVKADARIVKADGTYEGKRPEPPTQGHGVAMEPPAEPEKDVVEAEEEAAVEESAAVEEPPAEEAPAKDKSFDGESYGGSPKSKKRGRRG